MSWRASTNSTYRYLGGKLRYLYYVNYATCKGGKNMSTRKHGEVYSLQGILSRANEEQIYISRYLIVTAIKSGDLIARKVGKTYLIQWELFLSWVLCTPVVEDEEESQGE